MKKSLFIFTIFCSVVEFFNCFAHEKEFIKIGIRKDGVGDKRFIETIQECMNIDSLWSRWGEGDVELEFSYNEKGDIVVGGDKFKKFLGDVISRLNRIPLSSFFTVAFLRAVFCCKGIDGSVYYPNNCDSDELLHCRKAKDLLGWADCDDIEKVACNFVSYVKNKRKSFFDVFLDSVYKFTDIGCDTYFNGKKVTEDCCRASSMLPFLFDFGTLFHNFKINEGGNVDKEGESHINARDKMLKYCIKNKLTGEENNFVLENSNSIFFYLLQNNGRSLNQRKYSYLDGNDWNKDYSLLISIDKKDMEIVRRKTYKEYKEERKKYDEEMRKKEEDRKNREQGNKKKGKGGGKKGVNIGEGEGNDCCRGCACCGKEVNCCCC